MSTSGGKHAFWRNLANQKTQFVIGMVNNNLTLGEIGAALGGKSREYARQLIGQMEKYHGKKIFESREKVYSLAAVAKKLKVFSGTLSLFCRENGFALKKCGRRQMFTREMIQQLRNHPKIAGKRECVVCKKTFTPKNVTKRRIVCSKKCRRERHTQKHDALIREVPTAQTLRGWHSQVWQKLQEYTIAKAEVWLSLKHACVIAGISPPELIWLARRNIVATKPHPFKMWKGRRMRVYATSQMNIIRKAYQAYQLNHGKS